MQGVGERLWLVILSETYIVTLVCITNRNRLREVTLPVAVAAKRHKVARRFVAEALVGEVVNVEPRTSSGRPMPAIPAGVEGPSAGLVGFPLPCSRANIGVIFHSAGRAIRLEIYGNRHVVPCWNPPDSMTIPMRSAAL